MTSISTTSSSSTAGHSTRQAMRRTLRLPGRLIWRDAGGALRFAAVATRDVSDADTFVECQMPVSIPLYRLVHFHIEPFARAHPDLPLTLRQGKVLSAVYRMGPRNSSTGTPQGYALRLLVEPGRVAARRRTPGTVAATR